MHSDSRCNNPLNCADRQNTRSRGRQCRVHNGKLGKLGRTYGHCTVFTPRKYLYQKEAKGRKYLYQKEATGKERPEMYSASRCNYRTYLCGPSNYPVSREAV